MSEWLCMPLLSKRVERDRAGLAVEYVIADGAAAGFTDVMIDCTQVAIEKANGAPLAWGWFAFGEHGEKSTYREAFDALQQFLRAQGIELHQCESNASAMRKILAGGDASECTQRPRR